jgi:AraC family transcriptional regulator
MRLKMKPWLIHKPAFHVVGIPLNGGDLARHDDALWNQLSARYAEIPHADPDQGYGLHSLTDHAYSYIAGLAVRQVDTIPEGMAARRVPSNTYAVFVHNGQSAHLPHTVERAFSEWLPGSSYQLAGDYFFEYYDDRFHPGSPDSLISIYVPVKQRRD